MVPNREIPKDQFMSCMNEVSRHHVSGQVKLEQPVFQDLFGLGADIVTCRTIF